MLMPASTTALANAPSSVNSRTMDPMSESGAPAAMPLRVGPPGRLHADAEPLELLALAHEAEQAWHRTREMLTMQR